MLFTVNGCPKQGHSPDFSHPFEEEKWNDLHVRAVSTQSGPKCSGSKPQPLLLYRQTTPTFNKEGELYKPCEHTSSEETTVEQPAKALETDSHRCWVCLNPLNRFSKEKQPGVRSGWCEMIRRRNSEKWEGSDYLGELWGGVGGAEGRISELENRCEHIASGSAEKCKKGSVKMHEDDYGNTVMWPVAERLRMGAGLAEWRQLVTVAKAKILFSEIKTCIATLIWKILKLKPHE